MNQLTRRGFFGLLGATAVVPLVAVPALELGRRIFLPPKSGWVISGTRAHHLLMMANIKRDIENAIYDISPSLSPFVPMLSDPASWSPAPDWLLDTLTPIPAYRR
jgi:hypothetical protein